MFMHSNAVRVAVIVISLACIIMSIVIGTSSKDSVFSIIAWGWVEGVVIYCATYPFYRLLGNDKSQIWIIYVAISAVIIGTDVSRMCSEIALQKFQPDFAYRDIGRLLCVGLVAWLLKPRPPSKRNKKGYISRELERLLSRLRVRLAPSHV